MIDGKDALKLTPDLFTPLARTPWAGRAIAQSFKRSFVGGKLDLPIGESWEVSCDPSFPSQVLGAGMSLSQAIEQNPVAMLSPEYVKAQGPHCEILVKLLNAAQPLSVQVHPSDDDPTLQDGDCGKPESWLILAAEPGAGLYLGFQKKISKEHLRELLQNDADLSGLLQFVPVQPGDYFEIEPGVPHAIGPGLTLLEPQRVLSGKSGKTFRFWDWSRRYAADGSVDPKGKARELHIEEGLRLIDSEKQVGSAFVDSLRRKAQTMRIGRASELFIYPKNPYYQVQRLRVAAGDRIDLSMKAGFACLITLDGSFQVGKHSAFARGESGFIPANAFPLALKAQAESDVALVLPASCILGYD